MYSEQKKAPYEIKILTIHGHDFETYPKQDAWNMYVEEVRHIEPLENLFGTQVWPVLRETRTRSDTDLLLIAIGKRA